MLPVLPVLLCRFPFILAVHRSLFFSLLLVLFVCRAWWVDAVEFVLGKAVPIDTSYNIMCAASSSTANCGKGPKALNQLSFESFASEGRNLACPQAAMLTPVTPRSFQVTFFHLFHHCSITVIVGSVLPFGESECYRVLARRKMPHIHPQMVSTVDCAAVRRETM